jgi:hypothetical protein
MEAGMIRRLLTSLLVVVLALSLIGCGGFSIPNPLPTPKPTPKPTPTPTPTPPPPACPELGVPWCHEAGMQCGACKHQPPPLECAIMADPCPVEPPPVVTPPVVTPPAGTLPEAQPLIVDETLEARPLDTTPQERWGAVNAAIQAYRENEPADWNGTALAAGPLGIDNAFARISAYLWPIRAGQSIKVDGTRSDCLWVAREDARRYEEWHLFGYRDAIVASSAGAFKGIYELLRPACGEPVPPNVGRVEAKVHTIGPNWTTLDATRKVRSCEFCAATGQGMRLGIVQCGCTVRPEGHPEREACERLPGFEMTWRGPGEAMPGNDSMWRVLRGTGGTVIACVGEVCSDPVVVAP